MDTIKMNQVKTYDELVGKTIKSFPNYPENSQDLIIFFEDNTFAILSSYSDMDSDRHSNFYVNDNLTNTQARDLGFITHEEWLALAAEERKENAIAQLNWLKREYPELLLSEEDRKNESELNALEGQSNEQ